ncbi:hypothetical protein SI65_09043 [Aspergillus cristatus]|uniref:Uncharacterized protein n=1 Tax=Aspergillus cristatus TaxID=573508 RepID=A0A1E3B3A2_ASPCR|nr:hypothetical protein SI65_09043 [Aspergillus cristatus]
MTTDDPKKRPLPSFQLLRMQWNLQRVATLSAAAEWREEKHGDCDDDDDAARESVHSFLSDIDEGDDNYDDDGYDDKDDDEDDDDGSDHSPFDGSPSPIKKPLTPRPSIESPISIGRPCSSRPALGARRSPSTRDLLRSPPSPTRDSVSHPSSSWGLAAAPSLGFPSASHRPNPSP